MNECDLTISGASTAWPEILDEVPFKEAKTAEHNLMNLLRCVVASKQLQI